MHRFVYDSKVCASLHIDETTYELLEGHTFFEYFNMVLKDGFRSWECFTWFIEYVLLDSSFSSDACVSLTAYFNVLVVEDSFRPEALRWFRPSPPASSSPPPAFGLNASLPRSL